MKKDYLYIIGNDKGYWFEIDEYKMDSIKNTLTFYRIRYEDDKLAFEKPFR